MVQGRMAGAGFQVFCQVQGLTKDPLSGFNFYKDGDEKYYNYQKKHNTIRYVCPMCDYIWSIDIFRIKKLDNCILIGIDSQFSWDYMDMIIR